MVSDPVSTRALLVDAFTTEPLSGNPAGVVPDAGDLSEAQMQAVARELGASETAFRTSSGDVHRLRYFTPTQEVDLCGHATVATLAHLYADGAVDAGDHEVATNVGPLDVELTESGVVWLAGREEPTVEAVSLDYDRVGAALGVDPAALEDVGADLPPAVASTGLPWLCLPVNFLEHLGGATPDDDAVAALADEHEAAGVYAFTFDTLESASTLHARAFAPGIGIQEDPVTGTAAGACGGYLRTFDAFDDVPGEVRIEQGHFVDRPGVVRVRFEAGDEAGAYRVGVGGRAATALDGRIRVPRDADDDILVA